MRPLFLTVVVLAAAFVHVSAQNIDSLKALLEQAKGQKRAGLLVRLADAYQSRDWEQSVSYAEEGIRLAREAGNDSLLFEACYQLAESLNGRGNYTDALPLAREALTLAYDDPARSDALHLIGLIQERRAEYESALEYFLRALEIDKAIGDTKSAINTMNSISFVYRYMEQYDKAIEILNECLELSLKMGDENGVARATFNIGFNLVENNRGEEAIPYFRKAISGMREEDYPYRFSAYYNNMSNAYKQMLSQDPRYYDSCLYYADKNLLIKERLHDYAGIANAHNQLAAVYIKASEYARGKFHAQQALRLADSLDYKRILQNALLYAMVAEMGKNNLRQLHDYFAQYRNVSESLNEEAQSRTLSDMAVKYETEKKEAENKRLQELNEQKTKLNMALGAGGGMLLMMLMFLAFFYRRLDRDKKVIEAQTVELKKLNNLKSEFFANISHELRTPLTLAEGYVDLVLEKGETSEENASKLRNSRRSLRQLSRMIEDLLDLSKLEVGRYALKTVSIPVNQFIARLVAAFQSVYEDRGIVLTFADHTTRVHHCLLDVRHFEKVINNLLYNALKFTSAGGRVSVALHERNDGVEVRVSDNGMGIAEADLPFIFQRFFKANNSDEGQGTGLGLAIAREVVELHKGTIDVESKVGEGTTFTIRLGSVPAPTTPGDSITVEEAVGSDAIAWEGEKPHVLVVEDNSDMQDYLREILERAFVVTTVNSGHEALKWLRTNKPALITTDVMMPGMDGFQFLENVKGSPGTNMLPVMLLTAKASPDDRIRGLRLGVDDYITKPFDRDELIVRALNLVKNLQNRIRLAQDTESESLVLQREDARGEQDHQLVEHAMQYVEANIKRNDLTVDDIAAEVGISRAHFYRRLGLATGLTPNQFITEVRLQRAELC